MRINSVPYELDHMHESCPIWVRDDSCISKGTPPEREWKPYEWVMSRMWMSWVLSVSKPLRACLYALCISSHVSKFRVSQQLQRRPPLCNVSKQLCACLSRPRMEAEHACSVVKCKYCVSQKRNDKIQWYNIEVTFSRLGFSRLTYLYQ